MTPLIDPASERERDADVAAAAPFLGRRFRVAVRDTFAAVEFEAALVGVEHALGEAEPGLWDAAAAAPLAWRLVGYRFDNGVLVALGWRPSEAGALDW